VGQFSANINQGLSAGGDSAIAATWFLFNLWITLKALGPADVGNALGSPTSPLTSRDLLRARSMRCASDDESGVPRPRRHSSSPTSSR
jgi:hypothetical protein